MKLTVEFVGEEEKKMGVSTDLLDKTFCGRFPRFEVVDL